MSRLEKLQGPITKQDLGLEIGPSYNPVCSKSEGWNIKTVDHANRTELIEKYKPHSVDTSRIEEVDFVWKDGPLHESIPTELYGCFQYVIASHVIEHQPDLLSFLNSLEQLTSNDGRILLAIPDKRFCLDYFRPVQMTTDVLTAYLQRRTRHTKGTAFSVVAYSATADGNIAWGQHIISALKLIHTSLTDANQVLNKLDETGPYVDYHAWAFTLSSFALIILELHVLGYTTLSIDVMYPTEGCEFIVHLKKSKERETDGPALMIRRRDLLLAHMQEMAECLRFLSPSRQGSESIESIQFKLAALESTLAEREQQIAAFNSTLAEREQQIAALNSTMVEREQQIAELMNSTSWRITAPLRLLKSAILNLKLS